MTKPGFTAAPVNADPFGNAAIYACAVIVGSPAPMPVGLRAFSVGG